MKKMKGDGMDDREEGTEKMNRTRDEIEMKKEMKGHGGKR